MSLKHLTIRPEVKRRCAELDGPRMAQFSNYVAQAEKVWSAKLENLDNTDAELLLDAYDSFSAEMHSTNPAIAAYAAQVVLSLKDQLLRRLKPWKRDAVQEIFR